MVRSTDDHAKPAEESKGIIFFRCHCCCYSVNFVIVAEFIVIAGFGVVVVAVFIGFRVVVLFVVQDVAARMSRVAWIFPVLPIRTS